MSGTALMAGEVVVWQCVLYLSQHNRGGEGGSRSPALRSLWSAEHEYHYEYDSWPLLYTDNHSVIPRAVCHTRPSDGFVMLLGFLCFLCLFTNLWIVIEVSDSSTPVKPASQHHTCRGKTLLWCVREVAGYIKFIQFHLLSVVHPGSR